MSAAVRGKIRALERRCAQLRRQAKNLTHNRDKLLLRIALLTAWVDSLALLKAAAVQEDTEQQAAAEQEFQSLLQKELQLLDQMAHEEGLGDASLQNSTAALPHPGVDSISPPGDPMAYFRKAVALGAEPDAAHWTPLDVATMLRETVLQCSLQWNLNQQPLVNQKVVSEKDLWDRYLRVLMSLIVVGREEVGEEVSCFNLQSLEAREEYAVAGEQRTATLPPLLNLTETQKILISAAVEMVEGLSLQINQQRQELQARIAEVAAAAETPAGASPTTVAAGSSPDGGGSGGSLTASEAATAGEACRPSSSKYCDSNSEVLTSHSALNSHQERLEKQQQLFGRLKLLMAKEYMLVFTLVGFMIGCFSYDQLSLASALCWPYPFRAYFLAKDIHKMRLQELEEARRQQRVQAAQQQRRKGRRQPQEQQEGVEEELLGDSSC